LKLKQLIPICILLFVVVSCTEEVRETAGPLFEKKDLAAIGIDFANDLSYSREFNVYKYRNFYNGGGVAIGDVNNDGLADIYFTANQTANKLYLNKGGWKFEDITAQAGVAGSRAWATGTTMVDVNADGLLDIYVCNSGDVKGDNKENELFINQGDLTFVESAASYGLNDKGYSTHASFFDYDKDGDLDVYLLNNSFQAIGSFNLRKNERPIRDELGGDKLLQNDGGKFTDVSEQAGIYGSVIGFGLGVTIGDVNNDGWEDIFVSNDFFERDYLYINNQDGTFSEELVDAMPSISGASMGADIGDIDNDGYNDIFVTEMLPSDYERLKSVTTFESWDRYQYSVSNGYHHQYTRNTLQRNNGNLTFSEVSRYAGVEASDWSWGALFFDMDNDGYKDLFYIKVDLKGDGANALAVGASIKVTSAGQDQIWTAEQQPARGFQSSMDQRVHIGVGAATVVDVSITWPSGKVTKLEQVPTNTTLLASENDAKTSPTLENESAAKLREAPTKIDYQHKENRYVDFNKERLLYHMMSTRGPCVSVGDMNGDGIVDLVIPSPKDMPSSVLLGSTEGEWKPLPTADDLLSIKAAEHVECELLDADGDGDLDVYMASGGVELTKYSGLLYDKLLLNDGTGQLTATKQDLPSKEARISSSVVCHADVDGDGDEDIFVGERVKIGQYGAPCSGFMLINDGKGNYTDQTAMLAPALQDIGMITDAAFVDLDGNGREELIVVGEFMPITILALSGGVYKPVADLHQYTGWWQAVHAVDVDGDGDQDLVLANHGANSRFAASEDHPVKMYFSDFDKNGTAEGVMTHTRPDGKDYPYALRHTLAAQMPYLKKKFPNYESFKSATIEDIFDKESLAAASVTEATEMRSLILFNNGGHKYESRLLPASVQLSPMFAIASADLDHDGDQDIVMGGNLHDVQPEMGRYDASYGHLLINDGKGNYTDMAGEWGYSVKGEVRDILVKDDHIHVFRNDDSVKTFQIK